MSSTTRQKPIGDLAEPTETAQLAAEKAGGSRVAGMVSALALAISAYSLWETSLKQADVALFVPPVIHYTSPYNNTNFEVLSLPVTLTNEGARTGTILSMELTVSDPRSGAKKHFYAADLGRWTMERTRSGAYEPFAPISLAGRTSRTLNVLFYTRGEAEKPEQIIREVGSYNLELTVELAESQQGGWLGAIGRPRVPSVAFERSLKMYDARAFTAGTLPLYSPTWTSAHSGAGP